MRDVRVTPKGIALGGLAASGLLVLARIAAGKTSIPRGGLMLGLGASALLGLRASSRPAKASGRPVG